MRSFLQRIACVFALMIPFAAVAAEGKLSIRVSGAGSWAALSVQLYSKGEMKWRGVPSETGIVHPNVRPGTYQLMIRPAMVASYDAEVLLSREVTITNEEKSVIELTLPSRQINLTIDTSSMEHKFLIIRLDGVSLEAAGVRRWFTLEKGSALWEAQIGWVLAGQYRCSLYSSVEDAMKGEEFASLRLTVPESNEKPHSFKIVASIVSK